MNKTLMLVIIFSLITLGFSGLTYNRPDDPNMISVFGDSPLSLGKDSYTYVTNTTQDYSSTKVGILNYLTSDAAKNHYAQEQQEYTRTVEILTEELGVGNVPFGYIVQNDVTTIDNRITFNELHFSNGPIIQYYVGTPQSNSKGNMIFIHGCSGHPDKALGFGNQDYTNNAALEALNDGWKVYVLHIYSTCDLLDNYDALGEIYADTNLFGYYVMSIQEIIKHHELQSVTLYGISFGAQIAMYSSALIPEIEQLVISGTMLFNYADFIAEYNANSVDNNRRVGTLHSLRRRLSILSIVKFNSIKLGTPLIFEIGSFENKDLSYMIEFMSWCDNESECQYNLVYFKGYHETAPQHTLPLLQVSQLTQINHTLLPMIKNE